LKLAMAVTVAMLQQLQEGLAVRQLVPTVAQILLALAVTVPMAVVLTAAMPAMPAAETQMRAEEQQ
jgi:hypothetical protein